MKGRPRIVARSRAYAERRLRRVSITQDRSVSAGEDLARAFTLPASAYLDEATFAKERDLIFGRSWQLVARADELARVGDLKPATILDEPILITHGLDGKLRGFYNVCRHRAAQVVLSKGNGTVCSVPITDGPTGWTAAYRSLGRWMAPRILKSLTSDSCRSGWSAGARSSLPTSTIRRLR